MSRKHDNKSKEVQVWDYFFEEETDSKSRKTSLFSGRRRNEEDKDPTMFIGPLFSGSESEDVKRHRNHRGRSSPKKRREQDKSQSLVESLVPTHPDASRSQSKGRGVKKVTFQGDKTVKKRDKSQGKGRKKEKEDLEKPFMSTFLRSDEAQHKMKSNSRSSRKSVSNSELCESKISKEKKREHDKGKRSKEIENSVPPPIPASVETDVPKNRGLRRLWCGNGRFGDMDDVDNNNWELDPFSALFFDTEERDESTVSNSRDVGKHGDRQNPDSEQHGLMWPPYDLFFMDPPQSTVKDSKSNKKSKAKRNHARERVCDNSSTTSTTHKEKKGKPRSTHRERATTPDSRKQKKQLRRRKDKGLMKDDHESNSIREDEPVCNKTSTDSKHRKTSRTRKMRESAGPDGKPHYSEIALCQ